MGGYVKERRLYYQITLALWIIAVPGWSQTPERELLEEWSGWISWGSVGWTRIRYKVSATLHLMSPY
jgi:hypothetical protein